MNLRSTRLRWQIRSRQAPSITITTCFISTVVLTHRTSTPQVPITGNHCTATKIIYRDVPILYKKRRIPETHFKPVSILKNSVVFRWYLETV